MLLDNLKLCADTLALALLLRNQHPFMLLRCPTVFTQAVSSVHALPCIYARWFNRIESDFIQLVHFLAVRHLVVELLLWTCPSCLPYITLIRIEERDLTTTFPLLSRTCLERPSQHYGIVFQIDTSAKDHCRDFITETLAYFCTTRRILPMYEVLQLWLLWTFIEEHILLDGAWT